MTEAIKRQLAAHGIAPPNERKGTATTRTPTPAPTEPQTRPAPLLSAQNMAATGLAGVQVWKGVDGQGSVLRFFELSPTDKAALLAFAAELGIHPVRK